jgi:hypothetical protein
MDLSDQIHAFLHAISLADLVERKEILAIARKQQADTANEDTLQTDIIAGA